MSAFNVEEFCALGAATGLRGGELLYRAPFGANTDHFFATANQRILGHVFTLAVEYQVQQNDFASINVEPSFLFSRNFLESLISLTSIYPQFTPREICLEITERGGLQSDFNKERLLYLMELGFMLALDDVDIREPEELNRLSQYSPYIDVIKFPHQIMQTIRGKYCPELLQAIQDVRRKYPDKILVMEGVRDHDQERFLGLLETLGINYIQRSRYTDSSENAIQTVPATLDVMIKASQPA